jgi:hypothetical protein
VPLDLSSGINVTGRDETQAPSLAALAARNI